MIVLQELHGIHLNNQLKEGRARFKYFPGATSNDLLFYIEPTLGQRQFDTAIIHVGINDLLNKTAGIEVLLQNILNLAATCKCMVSIRYLLQVF